MPVRITLDIEDDLLRKAGELTGVQQTTSLVRMGLEALIAARSAERLAELKGTQRTLEAPPRRRTPKR